VNLFTTCKWISNFSFLLQFGLIYWNFIKNAFLLKFLILNEWIKTSYYHYVFLEWEEFWLWLLWVNSNEMWHHQDRNKSEIQFNLFYTFFYFFHVKFFRKNKRLYEFTTNKKNTNKFKILYLSVLVSLNFKTKNLQFTNWNAVFHLESLLVLFFVSFLKTYKKEKNNSFKYQLLERRCRFPVTWNINNISFETLKWHFFVVWSAYQ
jgi:hypothetical protein